MTKTEMVEEIVVLLGGGLRKSWCSTRFPPVPNDIERATKNCPQYDHPGMGSARSWAPLSTAMNEEEVFPGAGFSTPQLSPETVAAEIDGEIREVIDTCYESTRQVLEDHMDAAAPGWREYPDDL